MQPSDQGPGKQQMPQLGLSRRSQHLHTPVLCDQTNVSSTATSSSSSSTSASSQMGAHHCLPIQLRPRRKLRRIDDVSHTENSQASGQSSHTETPQPPICEAQCRSHTDQASAGQAAKPSHTATPFTFKSAVPPTSKASHCQPHTLESQAPKPTIPATSPPELEIASDTTCGAVHIGTVECRDFIEMWSRRRVWAMQLALKQDRHAYCSNSSKLMGFAVTTQRSTTFVAFPSSAILSTRFRTDPADSPEGESHSRVWSKEAEIQVRTIRRVMTLPKTVKILFDTLVQVGHLRAVGLTIAHNLRDPAAALWLLDNQQYVQLEPKPNRRPMARRLASIASLSLPDSASTVCALPDTQAMADARLAFLAEGALRGRLEGTMLAAGSAFSTLRQWYIRVEMPATETLVESIQTGLLINRLRLTLIIQHLCAVLRAINEYIRGALGWKPDLRKSRDVRKVVVQIGVMGIKDTKLETLLDAVPTDKVLGPTIVDLIISHRKCTSANSKLRNYLDVVESEAAARIDHGAPCVAVPPSINLRSRNGRIFNHAGPATFPKLLNFPTCIADAVPVTTVECRSIVEAGSGCLVICIDFEKFEACVAAVLSRDPALITMIRDTHDFFETIAQHLHLDASTVTPAMRDTTKRIFYGILNGMGPDKISRDADISQVEAGTFRRRLKAMFPQMFAWLATSAATGERTRSIDLSSGRTRHFIVSDKSNGYKAGLLQGSGADIVKHSLALLRPVMDELRERPGSTRATAPQVLLVMHDEIVFKIGATDVDAINRIRLTMEEVATHMHEAEVPFKVRVLAGSTWGGVHRVPEHALTSQPAWAAFVSSSIASP